MNNQDSHMPPWALGPFELIKHANEHLIKGGDIDRRIALISFDNIIELCIDGFLPLHPKIRDGLEISKEGFDKVNRNYHTKIAFLESYIGSKKIPLDLPVKDIIWYHQLRNNLCSWIKRGFPLPRLSPITPLALKPFPGNN